MFRIGIIELGITCGLIALAVIVPIIITRGYAAINRRIRQLEDKLKKDS